MKEKIIKLLTDNNIIEKLLCYLTLLEKTAAARWRALNGKNKCLVCVSTLIFFICLVYLAIGDSILLTIGYFAGLIIMTIYLVDTLVKQLPDVASKISNYALWIMSICFVIYFVIHLCFILVICYAIFVAYILIKNRKS